jgi:hypothetical protein
VCSVDVGSIGRTTYKLLSCDCVRVASQDPEEELAASNLLTIPIGLTFHPYVLVLNPKTSFNALESNY